MLAVSCLTAACGGTEAHSSKSDAPLKASTGSSATAESDRTTSPQATASSWSAFPTQSPDSTPYPTETSCRSSSFCVAVGLTSPSVSQTTDWFGLIWDGTRWNPMKVLPSVASNEGHNVSSASVSCPTTTFCMTVGQFSGVNTANGSFAKTWDGKAWKDVSPSVDTVDSPLYGFGLKGVSCTSSDDCWSVGLQTIPPATAADSLTTIPIAIHWNGSAWKAAVVPSQGREQLNGVSCVSPGFCMAVGASNYGGYGSLPTSAFAVMWNGAQWVARRAAEPNTGGNNLFFSVSCTSLSACMAVGGDPVGLSSPPLAQSWDGKGWTAVPTAAGTGASSAYFDSVSCTQAKSCMALGVTGVGGQSTINGTSLAERWDGSSWSFLAVPSGEGGSGAAGVSCSSISWCVGIAGGLPRNLLLRWSP